jgi:DNA repair protein RadA/Sms
MEGTRPVLLEVQALAVTSVLPVPRRVAAGVSLARVQLLVAILTKHCRLPLADKDVYVNVAGGLRIGEPAADLALALAIASSIKGKPLPKNSIVVGEVGLLGEIRRVTFLARRVKEAKALGYSQAITPETLSHITQAVLELG